MAERYLLLHDEDDLGLLRVGQVGKGTASLLLYRILENCKTFLLMIPGPDSAGYFHDGFVC